MDLQKAVQLLDSTWELAGGIESQSKVQGESRFLRKQAGQLPVDALRGSEIAGPHGSTRPLRQRCGVPRLAGCEAVDEG